MRAAVKLKQLSKSFVLRQGHGFFRQNSEVLAVNSINLTVPAGQSVAFIGPNGAGKSTTIKMLTGILRPSAGDAEVLGLTPWKQRSQLAYRIGVVFGQRSQLWYHLPAGETFELLARIYNLPKGDFRLRKNMLIERFGLGSFLNVPVRQLSLGQRMRAEIAASLLHKPEVIFLDEPTIGLDVVARQELRDVITQWNREEGLTVFLTSHDAGDIESVAKRVVVINHGQIVLDDRVSTVRRQYFASKVLDVKFHELTQPINAPGVTVLKASGYAMKLEVDCRLVAIEQVISTLLKAGSVADITIEDPPLEEVIAHIYGQAAAATLSSLPEEVSRT